MSKGKIIIIGGGIAGLSAGIHALLSGYEAEIYEKNAVMGGECMGWYRNGYYIDNCIHWLIGTKKDTPLNEIWRTVGAINDTIEILDFDNMYTSELNGKFLTLWKDPERTRKEMISLSPDDTCEINKLIDNCLLAKNIEIPCEKPSEMFTPIDGIKMAAKMRTYMKIMKEYKNMSIKELTDRFHHPLIKNVITDFVTKDSMAHSFIMAYSSFISGDGGLPLGGSRAFAARMSDKFETLGGKAYTFSPVTKINVENSHAVSAVLEDGKIIKGDYFICACDPDYTFNKLLSTDYMDKVFKEVYSNRKAYPVYGMFQVAFAVESEENVLCGELITSCTDIINSMKNNELSKHMSDRITLKTYSYEPTFAPEGCQILQVLCGFDEAAYDVWEKLYENKDSYKKVKNEIAELIKIKLETKYNEYKGKLSILDIWTPMTYKRWCNAYKGYNQAYIITKDSMKNPYPNAWLTGLDNVLIANQWLAAPGGLPGAVIQGKFAIMRIMNKK